MFTLFRTLLVIAHFLYSLYVMIYYACITVYRKYTEVWGKTSSITGLETLARTIARNRKIPTHLVIVFGLRRVSLLDCVHIIGWCITVGIPYISFFDYNGFLKMNETNLKEELAKKRPDLVEHIVWNSCTKRSSQNGITGNKSRINVSLLSNVDGKGKIVALTQSLAKVVSSGNLDPKDITEQLITERLQVNGMPDPDLALIYDYTYSTHGLLPWHTSTTEFLMLQPYVNISVKDFAYILDRYSKCVQRYGS